MNWRLLACVVLLAACEEKTPKVTTRMRDSIDVEKQYIRKIPGVDQEFDRAEVERGKVLIAYSDCDMCHTEKNRAKGPAFEDIAKRYPANNGYVELLARKIIIGGSGAWGYPVMSPHPEIQIEDAKLMVKYILSLESKK